MTPLLLRPLLKKNPDLTSSATREKVGSLAGGFGIFSNLLLFGVKCAVGILSGSISVISDAVNNLSDAGSSIVTLLGFKLSNRPADPEHPFGHGRIEYICGFLVSLFILLMGFELGKGSVEKILNPTPTEVSLFAVIILAASIGVKLYMAVFNRAAARLIDSAALKATAADSLSDCISTAAVLISLTITLVWGVNIDAWVGLLVSAFILWQGLRTAKETISPLLGEPPSKEMLDELESRVMSYEGFLGIHDVIIHNYGPGRTIASLHVEVPSNVDILVCHEEIDLCEKEVGEAMGMMLVIHMDPIEIDNETVNAAKESILAELKNQLPFDFSIHDFRMVTGEKRTNIIFDIVVSAGLRETEEQIRRRVQTAAETVNSSYICVVTVDRDFTSR